MIVPMSPLSPCLLVASPLLLDPNFLHAVVLLVDHDEDGALGIILNRPLPITLAQICDESRIPYAGPEEATAWRGGPVDPQRGIILVRGGMPAPEDTVIDFTDFISHRKDLLESLLMDPESQFRLFLGYSGWGAGQLDQELAQGAWTRMPLNPEWLLHPNPKELWRMAVDQGGH